MITLEQLIKEKERNGYTDISVIKAFFMCNDMEEEGIELIYDLTKSKIEKMKRRQDMAKEWTSTLPSMYLYENYDLSTANKLHNLEIDYLVNGGQLSDKFLEWAKENVPKIKRPEVYFNHLVDWLKIRGINFLSECSEVDK